MSPFNLRWAFPTVCIGNLAATAIIGLDLNERLNTEIPGLSSSALATRLNSSISPVQYRVWRA